MANRIKTSKVGIRYREHPSRKHGAVPDKYYTIIYKMDGRTIEESLGWSSQGWTLKKADEVFQELKQNRTKGTGPRTLREKRKLQERDTARQKAEGLTVSDFWESDYIFNLKKRMKKQSWQKETGHFTNRIKPAIGAIALKAITTEDIDRIIEKMQIDGLAARTQQYLIGTIFRMWKHASNRKLVKAGDNPATGIKLKRINNTRTRILTPDELKQILEFLKLYEPSAYDITLFCAFTGCRFSEASNLKYEYLDFSRETALFPETKNKDRREVFLIPALIDMLKLRGPKLAGKFVFTKKDGTPYREPPGPFRTAVKNLELNINRGPRDRVTFHTLRHTAATLAARRGTPVKDMQILFGWKTPSMVFRYVKGDEDTQKRAMAGLAQSLNTKSAEVIPIKKKHNT